MNFLLEEEGYHSSAMFKQRLRNTLIREDQEQEEEKKENAQ